MELKDILVEYCDLQQEIELLKEEIDKLDKEINAMEEAGSVVSDSVKGTRKDGTYGSIIITGFPYPEYVKKKNLLKKRMRKLEDKEEELHEALNMADDYIAEIPKSRTRTIFKLYYVEGLTWNQVAHKMNQSIKGDKYTADSCRMVCNRYLEKNK
jgi:hypothetical protein